MLLQLTVVLWGFTSILGRVISIHAVPLVWYRLVFTILALAVFLPLRGDSLRTSAQTFRRAALVGVCIGIHWLCFYGAVKEAGIALAVLTLSTIAFFTSLIEPLVYRRRVVGGEVAFGAIVVAGVALLLHFEGRPDPLGLLLGFVSSAFASLFGVLNGKLSPREPPLRLLFHEMLGAFAIVSLAVPFDFVGPWQLSGPDLGWLAVLAVACTVVPQAWALVVVRTLSPFTIALCVNLETVYALVLGAILFPATEQLGAKFYAGAAIVLALVVVNGVRHAAQPSHTSA